MKPLDGATRERVRELREQGLGWKTIARRTGVSATSCHRICDPEFAERMRKQSREAKRRRTGTCRECGATTRYNGKAKAVSDLCADCNSEKAGQRARDNAYWTRERCIAALLDAAETLGHRPGSIDFSPNQARHRLGDEERAQRSERIASRRWPWITSIVARFGSYRVACVAAGFEPHPPHGSSEGAARRRKVAA